MLEVGHRVVERLLVDGLVDGEDGAAREHRGVAVGRRLGDPRGAGHAAGAADILDDDLLAQKLAQARAPRSAPWCRPARRPRTAPPRSPAASANPARSRVRVQRRAPEQARPRCSSSPLLLSRMILSVGSTCQSALMPASRIGFAQRSISCGRYCARYSGLRCSGGVISRPSSSRRRRMRWIVERVAHRLVELAHDRLRRSLGKEERVPDAWLRRPAGPARRWSPGRR